MTLNQGVSIRLVMTVRDRGLCGACMAITISPLPSLE